MQPWPNYWGEIMMYMVLANKTKVSFNSKVFKDYDIPDINRFLEESQ